LNKIVEVGAFEVKGGGAITGAAEGQGAGLGGEAQVEGG
jgi:hypothetical protein